MATTTTLERLRYAVEDLRRALNDVEDKLQELEDDEPEPKSQPNAKSCECGHLNQWHNPTASSSPPVGRMNVGACLSPDCPCRKFEPAGGDA